MSMSNLVREPEIWVSMCRRFPWVVEERGEFGDGLGHLDFAALRRGVEKAADSGDVSTANDILAFVEDLVEKVDTASSRGSKRVGYLVLGRPVPRGTAST